MIPMQNRLQILEQFTKLGISVDLLKEWDAEEILENAEQLTEFSQEFVLQRMWLKYPWIREYDREFLDENVEIFEMVQAPIVKRSEAALRKLCEEVYWKDASILLSFRVKDEKRVLKIMEEVRTDDYEVIKKLVGTKYLDDLLHLQYVRKGSLDRLAELDAAGGVWEEKDLDSKECQEAVSVGAEAARAVKYGMTLEEWQSMESGRSLQDVLNDLADTDVSWMPKDFVIYVWKIGKVDLLKTMRKEEFNKNSAIFDPKIYKVFDFDCEKIPEELQRYQNWQIEKLAAKDVSTITAFTDRQMRMYNYGVPMDVVKLEPYYAENVVVLALNLCKRSFSEWQEKWGLSKEDCLQVLGYPYGWNEENIKYRDVIMTYKIHSPLDRTCIPTIFQHYSLYHFRDLDTSNFVFERVLEFLQWECFDDVTRVLRNECGIVRDVLLKRFGNWFSGESGLYPIDYLLRVVPGDVREYCKQHEVGFLERLKRILDVSESLDFLIEALDENVVFTDEGILVFREQGEKIVAYGVGPACSVPAQWEKIRVDRPVWNDVTGAPAQCF